MLFIGDVLDVRNQSRTHLVLIKIRFKVVNGARPVFNLIDPAWVILNYAA